MYKHVCLVQKIFYSFNISGDEINITFSPIISITLITAPVSRVTNRLTRRPFTASFDPFFKYDDAISLMKDYEEEYTEDDGEFFEEEYSQDETDSYTEE